MPLTVVRAPAGGGKTALLGEWARSVDAPGIWLTLDRDLGERRAFWRAVVTALHDAGLLPPGSPLGNGPLADDDGLSWVLRRGFGRLGRPHVLVVDGAESIVDPRIHEDLVTLVSGTETVNVVVGSRTRTPLEDPATATRVDHAVIDAADLLLTVDEIDDLVHHLARDGDPAAWPAGIADVVGELTMGHPAFTQVLLRTAHAESVTDADGLRRLAAGLLRDWLHTVLDDPSDPSLVTFLLRCSIPDRLPLDLLAALDSGDHGALAERLHRLEAMGLVDRERPSAPVELPVLLREPLRDEAVRRLAPELPSLHARIAHWELRHGTPLAALRHAVSAEDYGLVTTVLAHHWQRFLWDGVLVEAEAILEGIPRADLRRAPAIAAVLGLAANMSPARRGRAVGHLSLCIAGIRDLRRGVSRADRLFLDVLESSMLRIAGDDRGLVRRARSAARMLDEWSSELTARPSEPLYRTQLAISFFRTGHPREALAVLDDALSAPVDAPGLARHQALCIKAAILAHLGAMTESRTLVAQAEALPWPEGLRDSYLGAFRHYAAAWDALESFDLRRAQQHIDVLAPQHVNIELRPYLTMLQANVDALAGRSTAGLVTLTANRERDLAEQRALPPEQLLTTQAAAILHLVDGSIGTVRRILEQLPATAGNYALGAAVELVVGRHTAVLEALAAAQDVTDTAPRVQVLHDLVLASAALREGDRHTARAAAERLAALTRHHGLRSHLAMVPRADLLAVHRHLADERPGLVDALGDLDDVPDVTTLRLDVALLTEREGVVLRELGSGAPLADIAATLGVSVNTIKTQVRTTYRKLGASSREEALSIAIREGLLTGDETSLHENSGRIGNIVR